MSAYSSVHLSIGGIAAEGNTGNTTSMGSDLERNHVAYISDNMGLHRVENTSHSDTAVSLHIILSAI
ncbi:cysteine dioxygenase type 1-like [Glossina fuscipes fuscipes]